MSGMDRAHGRRRRPADMGGAGRALSAWFHPGGGVAPLAQRGGKDDPRVRNIDLPALFAIFFIILVNAHARISTVHAPRRHHR
ncbi:hypothetical protein Rmf_50310 [Roseomonas fluvialis]|uniref:Uncharacterized protein n=1 Tax=Roseomonas fluvialis TaxID=1750527 RepID=A0ABM7YAU3_9PROT|nr:hypothetical protein Rmf_50310 [Roseomonas fluvialis]